MAKFLGIIGKELFAFAFRDVDLLQSIYFWSCINSIASVLPYQSTTLHMYLYSTYVVALSIDVSCVGGSVPLPRPVGSRNPDPGISGWNRVSWTI